MPLKRQEIIRYRKPLKVEYLNPLPVLRRSPCFNCEHSRQDKEKEPCKHCQKAYHYDLGLSDRELVRETLVEPGPESPTNALRGSRRKKRWPEELVELALRLRARGLSVGKIADIAHNNCFKVSRHGVVTLLKSAGAYNPLRRPHTTKARPFTDNAKNKAVELRKNGMNYLDIWRELKNVGYVASKRSVYVFLKEAFPMTNRKKRRKLSEGRNDNDIRPEK